MDSAIPPARDLTLALPLDQDGFTTTTWLLIAVAVLVLLVWITRRSRDGRLPS
jgi:hypothetical protein